MVILETVRAKLATPNLDSERFDELVDETDIMEVIFTIFRRDDGIELASVAKSKALNLCVNLLMGSSSTVQEVMEPKYGVLAQVERVLVRGDSYDQLENSLWFLGNALGEKCSRLTGQILSETQIMTNLQMLCDGDSLNLDA